MGLGLVEISCRIYEEIEQFGGGGGLWKDMRSREIRLLENHITAGNYGEGCRKKYTMRLYIYI